ncbi:hypothetical protein Cmtc_17380 [Cupriavidus sp. TKC]|nr:hypothetical protein Cmtc_17380 [Cupriavidus sp. TKC]
MTRLSTESADNEAYFIDLALQRAGSFPTIPGIGGPYTGFTMVADGRRYYYVAGKDEQHNPRLFEVFQVNMAGELSAVPAYLYPKVILEVFPRDLEILGPSDSCDTSKIGVTTCRPEAGPNIGARLFAAPRTPGTQLQDSPVKR